MSANEVPVIDLSAFLQEWEAMPAERRAATKVDELPQEARTVVRAWREAFGKFGFCSAIGHGIPDEVIENAYACARKFFDLPMEEKKLSDTGRPYGSAGGGFKAQGAESVSKTETANPGGEVAGVKKARPSDRVESMVYFGNDDDVIPKAVPEYVDVMERYRKEVFRLLLGSMALTAASLDLPLGHFEPFFPTEKLSAAQIENSIRLAYYPAYKEGQEPLPGQMRYGEHTDYTGFTFLWQDHNVSGPQTASSGLEAPPGGLQVRMPDGSWVDCPPKPKAFTINAGDLIQAWTNDVFLSNYHRVVNPPPGDRHDRISIVYFTGPTNDTMVEPLPTCVGPDRPARYSAISAGEHLNKKLKVSNA